MQTTTEIMGGLGNQLFQIFNLLAYSFRHKTRFYFSPEPITHGQRKTTYWNTSFLNSLQPFVKQEITMQKFIYSETNFHYQEIPTPPSVLNNTLKLFGYFQSYKYFQDQQELIYRFIRLRESQSLMREKTQHIYAYANTTALHFRVGDYKNLPNHHPLMTLEYYTAALIQLLQDTKETDQQAKTILYFCEEADQAYIQEKLLHPLKQNPLFQNKFTFQCIDHNLSDWEQLIVMSLCRHHIIANSTFSWWGAYLGLGENPPTTPLTPQASPPHLSQSDASAQGGSGACPQVYYPTTWFGSAMGNKNMTDLFPSHWHRINI
jgi:hypothetical protein